MANDSFKELADRIVALETARDTALREVQNLRELVNQMKGELAKKEPANRVDDEPIREIIMDDWFIAERTDKKHIVMFNEEKLKRNTMAMPPQGVDRYQHCTEPFEFIDVFLPSAVAWSSYGPDTVVRIETADGILLCFELVEVNVNETLTSGIFIESVANTCDTCTDSGGSSGADSGDHPYDDGIRVTDINCTGDGTGDLIVSYINERTGDQFAEIKTGCCCDSGMSPTFDEWIPCGGGTSIFLNPTYFDDAPSPDPIIQINGYGCCYKLNARLASGTETTPTQVTYMSTCDDSACADCSPAPCVCDTSTAVLSNTYSITEDLDACVLCAANGNAAWNKSFTRETVGGTPTCRWFADPNGLCFSINGKAMGTTGTLIELNTSDCRWELRVYCGTQADCGGAQKCIWYGIKTVGATPSGTYTLQATDPQTGQTPCDITPTILVS